MFTKIFSAINFVKITTGRIILYLQKKPEHKCEIKFFRLLLLLNGFTIKNTNNSAFDKAYVSGKVNIIKIIGKNRYKNIVIVLTGVAS